MSQASDLHVGLFKQDFLLAEDSVGAAGPTLDPVDWKSFRTQAHRMMEDMLDYVEHIRDRPVWQPMPPEVRASFRAPLPLVPQDLELVHAEFMQEVLPYAAGNVHPSFLGWVHGGGTPVGMLAEMLAAGLNANLGGRDQAPVEVERQLNRWVAEIFGFPESATGLFVTGASVANLIAVIVARDRALGFEVRGNGIAAAGTNLTAYASTGAHGCIGKALDLAGIGSSALRLIPTDRRHCMDLTLLEAAISGDRSAGRKPFLVVGTAGTVDTGATDDLAGIAAVCGRENLWFHVDGAYGALARLAPDLAPRLAGIEQADSLAFDFHKWGQVPYDAGYVLVRNGELHRKAFASAGAYLERAERGLAANSPWPCDFGPDLSRGFRALKAWFTLKVYGTRALGAVISHSCELARSLESRIEESPELELLAPVALNIVCFRYRAAESDRINQAIVIALQESGMVAPSTTRINGRLAIRAAIVNHRTSAAELEALVEATLSLGRALDRAASPQKAAKPAQEPPSRALLQAALQTVEGRLCAEGVSTALLFEQSRLLERLGRNLEARKSCLQVIEMEATHRGALHLLGDLLLAAEEMAEARSIYAEAVALYPDDVLGLVSLARSLMVEGKREAARAHLEHALSVDPKCRAAHAALSFVLAELNEAELALVHRRAAFQGRCVIPGAYRGEGPPVTVLKLISTNGGNLRTEGLLSDCVFETHLVAAEFYDETTVLPPHHVIVNAIGDADIARSALAGARSLLDHTTAPVINLPAAVAATGRGEIARRLAGVPGVITAKTLQVSRDVLAGSKAGITLADLGFAFPVLLRTPGFHGGENFVLVEALEGLSAAVAELPGADLYVIQFLDARGADGKTRKYRVMMIGGELYPLHAAISNHWKIHYFSADMQDSPEHRAEEADFLGDMRGALGPRAATALEQIQKTLGLDYGGIDFGLNADGDVLLFEANATMAIFPPGEDSRWDYRRSPVERALRAVRKMLIDRAMSSQTVLADREDMGCIEGEVCRRAN